MNKFTSRLSAVISSRLDEIYLFVHSDVANFSRRYALLDRFRGTWKSSEMDGLGVYSWPDGKKYEGEFAALYGGVLLSSAQVAKQTSP